MAQNQNQGYQPIDESKVNWDKIEEKFGISKEVLERTGAKDNMLNFSSIWSQLTLDSSMG